MSNSLIPTQSTSRDALSGRDTGVVNDAGFLKHERNRLETFRTWPSSAPIPPKDLAQSGFIYTGNEDRVQCVFCHGILKGWDPGDDPHKEHKKRFAHCGFIKGLNVGNVPLQIKKTAPSVTPALETGSHRNLGVISERPVHENFAIEATRIFTFENAAWGTEKFQTPEMLAAAGFFYAGINDNVKCFFCDGGMRNWEPGDDPWTEHARYFPNCHFVRLVKGEDFIKKVHEKYENKKGGGGIYGSGVSKGRRSRDSQNYVDESVIQAHLDLPWVKAILDTGISRELVKEAIRNRLRDYGSDFEDSEDLMETVLNMQDTRNAVAASSSRQDQNSAKTEASFDVYNQKFDPDVDTKATPKPTDLAKENKMLRDQKTCKVCLDKEVGMVFLPCGHLCCCVACAQAVRRCPMCRTDIKGSVRTYIP